MSELDELTSHELEAIEDIGRRMKRGEKVSLQDQLKYLRLRESRLSLEYQKKGKGRVFHRLEKVRNEIEKVNEKIMQSGDRGGGVMGEGSIKDSRNPPR